MANLAEFEKRLNQDEKFRKEFMADPAALMEKEGIILSAAMKKSLKNLVKDLQSPSKKVPGSSISPKGWGVGISISKEF